MGWLHKTKHRIEENRDESEIKIENLDSLQHKIHAQQDHLDSISKKIEVVKGEYGEVISSLMSAKKEFLEKKNEIISLKSLSQDVQDKQKKSKKGDSLEFKKQLDMEDVLNDFKIKQKEVEEQLQKTNWKLKGARVELENIEQKKLKIFEESTKKNSAKIVEKNNLSTQKDNSKNVVKAASAVIATMQTKLTVAEKELETMMKLLDEEKKEHQKTKNELESLRSKN